MNPKKPVVTLEDLMRVKRAERPPVEFWAEFEREMRRKQLAAIVEPRPWWAPFIRVSAKVARYQVPMGAAAILALTFVSVKEYRSTDFAPTFVPEITAPTMSDQPLAELPQSDQRIQREPTMSAPPPDEQATQNAVATTAAEISTSSGRVSHSVQVLDSTVNPTEPTPSARYIAANLAAAQAADPRLLDEVFGPSAGVREVREPMQDPLSRISSPGESRRSRLLATALPAAVGASDVSVGSSDRVARRLTEERLYDSISRVGVRGDRVAIKF